MDNHRYIWCRNCGAIHHVSAFDRAPIYAVAGGEVQETAADDWRDFTARHAGHRLEPLKSTGSRLFVKGTAFDPMSIAYVQVSNGEETMLLKRSRSSIERPFAYEIVNGKLIESEPSLEIQDDAIRKEMKLHFSWAPAAPLTDDQITMFVTLFRETIQQVDPAELSVSEYSDLQDDAGYFPLASDLVDELMEKCRAHFPLSQIAALRRFIESHRDGCGVMTLVKRTVIAIAPHG
jgi:hypothetical protein